MSLRVSSELFLIVLFVLLGCCSPVQHSDHVMLAIPATARIVVSTNNKELTNEEAASLRTLLRSLKPTRKALYAKADTHLLVYPEEQTSPTKIAVFLKDGVVYEGYFLDAWSERMEGGESECFKLNRDAKEMIERLLR